MIHAAVADQPELRFGLVSDIQYADIDNRFSVAGEKRYYRAALPSVERAVAQWNREQVQFAVQRGDIIDGHNRKSNQSEVALDRVLGKLQTLHVPCKHVLGNHCTCQFENGDLLRRLGFEEDVGYYSFEPAPRWKLVVLDTCDISLYAWPRGHPNREAARAVLQRENPNEDWGSSALLEGAKKRFASYNGGLGQVQLQWLRCELEAAEKSGQDVILFTHIPIQPKGVIPSGILWNFEEVQEILHQFPSRVKAVFSGHVHKWTHSRDDHGIHYFTLPGVVEVPPDTEGHGIVEVYRDFLLIRGFSQKSPFIAKWTE